MLKTRINRAPFHFGLILASNENKSVIALYIFHYSMASCNLIIQIATTNRLLHIKSIYLVFWLALKVIIVCNNRLSAILICLILVPKYLSGVCRHQIKLLKWNERNQFSCHCMCLPFANVKNIHSLNMKKKKNTKIIVSTDWNQLDWQLLWHLPLNWHTHEQLTKPLHVYTTIHTLNTCTVT